PCAGPAPRWPPSARSPSSARSAVRCWCRFRSKGLTISVTVRRRRSSGRSRTERRGTTAVAKTGRSLHSAPMIRYALAAAVALLTPGGGAALAQAPASQPLPFVLKQVGPGVYAAIDGPEHKAGSNAGFIIGDDGVLVVDAFFTPE